MDYKQTPPRLEHRPSPGSLENSRSEACERSGANHGPDDYGRSPTSLVRSSSISASGLRAGDRAEAVRDAEWIEMLNTKFAAARVDAVMAVLRSRLSKASAEDQHRPTALPKCQAAGLTPEGADHAHARVGPVRRRSARRARSPRISRATDDAARLTRGVRRSGSPCRAMVSCAGTPCVSYAPRRAFRRVAAELRTAIAQVAKSRAAAGTMLRSTMVEGVRPLQRRTRKDGVGGTKDR